MSWTRLDDGAARSADDTDRPDAPQAGRSPLPYLKISFIPLLAESFAVAAGSLNQNW